MKYNGVMYCYGRSEPFGTVTNAVLTMAHISIDWDDPEGGGHLDTSAGEADEFEGIYSVPGQQQVGRFAFKRYLSGEEVLLFGTWAWPPRDEGCWTFVLTPRD